MLRRTGTPIRWSLVFTITGLGILLVTAYSLLVLDGERVPPLTMKHDGQPERAASWLQRKPVGLTQRKVMSLKIELPYDGMAEQSVSAEEEAVCSSPYHARCA